MRKKTAFIWCGALLCALAAGCAATLEDFQGMSPAQRAQIACESDRDIRRLNLQAESAYAQMGEVEAVISRGYRLHESCKQVLVPSREVCTVKGTVTVCTKEHAYETVCEQTPVAIDGALERKKLEEYKNEYYRHQSTWEEQMANCADHVRRMSAQQAFEHYQSVR